MDTVRLSLDVVNTSANHNLCIELWIDKDKFFDSEISPGQHHIIHQCDLGDGEHIFRLKLKNKSSEYTQVDSAGNIVSDATVRLDKFVVDDIDISQLFVELGQYIHDGNGSEETVSIHKFYSELGCNGHAQLSFNSPIYLWLLENM